MTTTNDIQKALSHIIDPDFNKDIVSLGFVKNINIQGNKVNLDIELTTPACPIKAEFQQKAEQAIMALEGIDVVKVNMTSRAPQKRPGLDSSKSSLSNVKSIIAISSCKGGVGKSTMAAQISYTLAQRGFKVGLVDTDIHGPSIPTLFNLVNQPVYSNDKQQIIPLEKDHLKIMSFGFLLGDAPAVMRGPIVSRYVQQVLHQTEWGELDYLFIDMPPGTGDVQLTITQSVQLSGAVIITTRQTLSLVDVARGILMFEKVNVPILGIIENMSYFICDNCDKKHYIFGGEKDIGLTDRFGVETLAEIPLLPELTNIIHSSKNNKYISEAVDKVVRAQGKMSIAQTQVPKIHFDAKKITVEHHDGKLLAVNNMDLRASCRCALCVNELTGDQILQKSNIKPEIAPTEIMPLGNYALSINWNDGHTSGIYPYSTIEELAQTK